MSCYCLPLGMVGRFQLPSCNCSFHRKGLSCFAICCFACSMPSPKEVQHVQRPATIPEQSSTVDADDQVPLEPSQITCRFLDFVACLHVFMSSHWISSVRVMKVKWERCRHHWVNSQRRSRNAHWNGMHVYMWWHVFVTCLMFPPKSPNSTNSKQPNTEIPVGSCWLENSIHFQTMFTIFHHLSPKMFTHLPRVCQGQGLASGGAPRDGDRD